MGAKREGWLRQIDLDSREGRLRQRQGPAIRLHFDASVSRKSIADAFRRQTYSEYIGRFGTSGAEEVFFVFAIHPGGNDDG